METPKINHDDRGRLTKVLAQCPLFRALKEDHFPQIFKAGEVRTYAAGETIVEQGKAAESFFVLLGGEASITVSGAGGEANELGRLRSPSSLGEVGLLLDEVRSASIQAVKDVTVLRFAEKAFEAMFQKIPGFGMGLSTGLAHRLSQVSGKIRLPEYDTRKGEPSVETASLLPSELCRRHRMLPLEKDGAVLTVGFVDEPTTEAMSSVRNKLPSMELTPVQIDSKFYNDVMRKQAGVKGWTTGEMPQVDVPAAEAEKPRSERLDALLPSRIMTMEELALPGVLNSLSDIPKGLVLITGPTGSGKSTTLAAMIDYIKRDRKCHILTLEDPVEFLQSSDKALVNQREIGGHTTSFGRALRAALREDPDIVLVGEMRDRETIMLALETANTGHLVFATLHTNNAITAIDRVIDQFPSEEQAQVRSVLADVLRGVVAQTLVRKPGGGRCSRSSW